MFIFNMRALLYHEYPNTRYSLLYNLLTVDLKGDSIRNACGLILTCNSVYIIHRFLDVNVYDIFFNIFSIIFILSAKPHPLKISRITLLF